MRALPSFPGSSSPQPTSFSNPSADLLNLSREAYMKHQLTECGELLKRALDETEDEMERRCLHANLILCEAKSKAELFHDSYRAAMLSIFPKLNGGKERNLDDCEAVAAFNLALNAFARGLRRTGLELLQSVIAKNDLSDSLFYAVSLVEIETSLNLCQPKLALKQAMKLRDSAIWRRGSIVQHDSLDCLECRIRCRLAQTSPVIDFSLKLTSLHWCLIQSELDMKNGNAARAVNRLLRFRPSLNDEERRLVDNALGCVYALSLKKPSLAECYFRSAMSINPARRKSWQESTIPRHCLIYHTALAQLHCGQACSAFALFLAVLPFYPKQPRIWLRIAECCIHALTNNENESRDLNERSLQIKTVRDEHVFLPSTSHIEENSENDKIPKNEISWEYAAYCIRNALVLTGADRDFVYLLPWLYAASAFINLNLSRYGLALKAAHQLATLPQVSSHHKLMAVLYRTEALVLLDRLPEAVECITQAVPLKSMPSTVSAVIYNKALLQALSGNLHKSLTIFGILGSQWKLTAVVPEAVSLGVYINMKLGRYEEARRFIGQ